jgi:hypothetical protein
MLLCKDRNLAMGDMGGRVETLDMETRRPVWGLRYTFTSV